MDNTWQAQQWFDIEMEPNRKLYLACQRLRETKQEFNTNIVKELLEGCPIRENVDVHSLVDDFNQLMKTLH